MSTTTILSAINFNATAAAEKNRTTGAAVALFKKGGKEVNTSEKALGRDCLKGITAEQYETYCKAVRAVYLDADLLARYAADADSVQKIKTFYFNDLTSLTTAIMGDTFKVNDVFATFTVEQFIEQSVGKVRAFTATTAGHGYDTEAESQTKFVKWVEAWFSANASGVAMLTMAERDRRASVRKLSSKVVRLTKSVENAEEVLSSAKKELDSLKSKKDTNAKTLEKKMKAVQGMEKDLADVKKSLESAQTKLADLQSKDFTNDFSAEETL